MQTSPETYPIADFLKWDREKELILNPSFQRGSVWKESAKSYLIDTILRGMPIPKILFRTRIDRRTKQIVREVVDGQQRLRAILAFANDDLRLGIRAKGYAGLRYSDLEPADQDQFLAYKLTTEQLINAANEDVLEIFARINSYTVPVNAPELRHAKYDSDFKWSVVEVKTNASEFWSLGTLSERERVRMLDASLIAEMYGLLLQGVTDGGQPRINRLYDTYKDAFPEQAEIEGRILTVLALIGKLVAEDFAREPIVGAPHMLMLFGAIAHVTYGLPRGQLTESELSTPKGPLQDLRQVRENLRTINEVLEMTEPERAWASFWAASKSSTQRIASRRVRFPVFVRALGSIPLLP